MKLELIVQHKEALTALSGMKFDAEKSWEISVEMDKAEEAISRFDKQREEWVKKNGEVNPDKPDNYLIKDIPAFQKYMDELGGVDVKLNFPKITRDMINGTPISPAEIKGLKKLKILT